ncbi:MAG: hypothetical protein JXR54_07225 [Tannerellaceae bacterium]|nr:hypothetical protein [Tannerellaceae bacterium]
MSNFKIFIENRINPYFEKEGYKKRKKESITYNRKDGDKEFFFILMPYMAGHNTKVTYGILFKQFQKVYSEVMQEDFIEDETIKFDCFHGFYGMVEKKGYRRVELESEDDLIIAEGIVKDIYENYTLPFYAENSTLKRVLNTLRKVEGVPFPMGNKIHSLNAERSIMLELFLTKLFLPEEIESRVEYYKKACHTASKEHEEKTGEKDGYLYILDIMNNGIDKMNNANWDEIRKKLITS